MRRRTRTTRAAAIAIAVGLVIAACGSGEETSAPAPSTPGAAPSAPAPAAPARTTLEFDIYADAPNFIPFEGSIGNKKAVMQLMMLPLLETDETNAVVSRVLESWDFASDAQSITLRLNDGIEWSDGTPLTVTDVVMTLTQLLDRNISAWGVRFGGVVGQDEFVDGTADTISGLVLVDDRTVRIDLVKPDVAWVSNVATNMQNTPVLPAHILGDVPHGELKDHPYFAASGGFSVVSGPFKLVEWRVGEYTEFVRNENYSYGLPYFERVFLKLLTSDVAAAQLQTGEIQFLHRIVPSDASRLGALPRVKVLSVPGTAPDLWSIMHDVAIDKRIRQAMLFGLDREAICEQALQGYCSTQTTNIRLVGEAVSWAVPTTGMTEYTYDPDKARALIAEAVADGAWDPSTVLIFNDRTGAQSAALQIAQGMMAAVGINWEIVNVDVATLISNIREEPIGTIDGFWVTGADFSADPSSAQTYYECATARTGANLISYCHPELDALWAKARTQTVLAERQATYHDAFRFMNDEIASIYLYVEDNIYAHDERLKGIKGHANKTGLMWDVADWYWEE